MRHTVWRSYVRIFRWICGLAFLVWVIAWLRLYVLARLVSNLTVGRRSFSWVNLSNGLFDDVRRFMRRPFNRLDGSNWLVREFPLVVKSLLRLKGCGGSLVGGRSWLIDVRLCVRRRVLLLEQGLRLLRLQGMFYITLWELNPLLYRIKILNPLLKRYEVLVLTLIGGRGSWALLSILRKVSQSLLLQ